MDPVERKLAAILATDVVSYSRLMSEDEAGTHARLTGSRHDLNRNHTLQWKWVLADALR
jgi:class 3 adenylate cyclase